MQLAVYNKNYASLKVTRLILVFATWLFCIFSLTASELVRGGLILHEVNGQVGLKELGKDITLLNTADVPITTMGMIECEASDGSSAFFTASNRSAIYFEGSGSFAVERFEQVMPELAEWNVQSVEQSRIILNFRAGDLIVDTRKMRKLESSQFLVETPLGRLACKRALWQMRILFDPRSQIFDFTIICTEGQIRFTDLQGQQYAVQKGRRLEGAGSRMKPSIEVGESTERSQEQMQRYLDLSSQHSDAADDFTRYLAYLEVIERNVGSNSERAVLGRLNTARRPIVIEFAKEPKPVTPFRAVLTPPSADQADLF